MSEELKVFVEVFSKATDTALFAYLGYLVVPIIKSMIVCGTVLGGLHLVIKGVFVNESSTIKADKKA